MTYSSPLSGWQSAARATSVMKARFVEAYRRPSLTGSCSARYSHSSPCRCHQAGARLVRPGQDVERPADPVHDLGAGQFAEVLAEQLLARRGHPDEKQVRAGLLDGVGDLAVLLGPEVAVPVPGDHQLRVRGA